MQARPVPTLFSSLPALIAAALTPLVGSDVDAKIAIWAELKRQLISLIPSVQNGNFSSEHVTQFFSELSRQGLDVLKHRDFLCYLANHFIEKGYSLSCVKTGLQSFFSTLPLYAIYIKKFKDDGSKFVRDFEFIGDALFPLLRRFPGNEDDGVKTMQEHELIILGLKFHERGFAQSKDHFAKAKKCFKAAKDRFQNPFSQEMLVFYYLNFSKYSNFKINILEATKLAMTKAVKNLETKHGYLGCPTSPKITGEVGHQKISLLILDGDMKLNLPIAQKSIIICSIKNLLYSSLFSLDTFLYLIDGFKLHYCFLYAC